MNKPLFIKLFLLILVLLIWKLAYTNSCIVFIFSAFVVISFLAISFAENSLLYRKSVADIIFNESSWMFTWLQSKWFVLLKSIMQALFFGIVFLLGSLQWGIHSSIIMGIDVFILLGLFFWLSKYVAVHTKIDVRELFTRKLATTVNVTILTPILIIIMFYSVPPEYLNSSLSTTLSSAQQEIPQIRCSLVSMLYSYDIAKESFLWWSMMSASLSLNNNMMLIIGWSLFLLFETMYVWVFSKLILSTTIHLNTIFNKRESE